MRQKRTTKSIFGGRKRKIVFYTRNKPKSYHTQLNSLQEDMKEHQRLMRNLGKHVELPKPSDRMEQLARLWAVGATAIAMFVLFILGLQAMFYVLSQAYAMFFTILGALMIPILIAMFCIPKDFLRKRGIEI